MDNWGSLEQKHPEPRPPWWEYRLDIISVEIDSGITSVGTFAFAFLNNLSSIEIPSTVTYLGKYATHDCNINYILVPESVEYIGDVALHGKKNGECIIYAYAGSYAESYADIVINKLTISQYANKTTYYIGDSLDTTGLALKMVMPDLTEKTITSGYTITGFDSSNARTNTVTVYY